jgi:putative DNA primase/helicase
MEPMNRTVQATSTDPPSLRRLADVPQVAGDHLNAQRFLASYGDMIRRSPELGRWFVWNGSWWEEDRLDRVLDLAAHTIDELRLWAAEADSSEEFDRRAKHYRASTRASRRDALLAIAGTDPDVVVGVSQLDTHPLLIACTNGTVNLFTGELQPANPADLLTHGVGIAYDPEAVSDIWEQFIDTTFGGNDELIAFVQRLLGYCCTGIVEDHVLPVFTGTGANGKSTLVGVVQDVLGDHAITAPEGLVIQHSHERHP